MAHGGDSREGPEALLGLDEGIADAVREPLGSGACLSAEAFEDRAAALHLFQVRKEEEHTPEQEDDEEAGAPGEQPARLARAAPDVGMDRHWLPLSAALLSRWWL
jgi:hypothetical protein